MAWMTRSLVDDVVSLHQSTVALSFQQVLSCFPAFNIAEIGASALESAVIAAVRAAMQERELFDRMNPFARSHHSDSISLHTAVGAARFPGSEGERVAFKQTVAEFYGLTSVLPRSMVDMFGNVHFRRNVTLAHIWPASYTNWEDPRNELALPEGFHQEPRNFLLLLRDVHEAFDAGHIIFVPAPSHITCYVLPGKPVKKGLYKLHGKKLHLPRHDAGGVPYKRQLAYFALRAKGRATPSFQDVERRLRAINVI